MANGFAQPLLTHLAALEKENYPGFKITPAGMTAALVENNPSLEVISIDGQVLAPGLKLNTTDGQVRRMIVKYLPRATANQVDTSDNCNNDIFYQYKEQEITAPLFRKATFFLPWNFLELYEKAAIQRLTLGTPSVGVVKEIEDQIKATANALVTSIDTALISQTVFGVNQVTGSSAVTPININKDATVLDLSSGMLELLYDVQQNEIYDSPIIVGNGNLQKLAMSGGYIGMNQAGINPNALQAQYKFYQDINTRSAWGQDYLGVFAKGTIGLVDIDKYIGWKVGRFGISEFLQIEIPIQTNPLLPPVMMTFNLQIQEADCPTTQNTPGYGSGTSVVGRGYKVILSKNFGLWQQANDAYSSGDRLTGNNGALQYQLTNTCVSC